MKEKITLVFPDGNNPTFLDIKNFTITPACIYFESFDEIAKINKKITTNMQYIKENYAVTRLSPS